MELFTPTKTQPQSDDANLEQAKGIHGWMNDNGIKNEKGDPIDFFDHRFLFDIYADQSQNLTVMKAAQVGLSTLQILKNHHDAKRHKMDIIYTLPTDQDVRIFVGGKVNRIIANNQTMLADVKDKDSIEVKQVGNSVIYFRGTFTKKAAIMVTADRLVHDEKDSSKLDVIADFQARLQHSKYKQTHTFSHPDLPETGVHNDWLKSDQKHWHVLCPSCKRWHFMEWNTEDPRHMSVDMERGIFICKKCRAPLPDYARRNGQWIAKYPGREWSGYWVPQLIAPWISAKDLIKKWKDPETTPHFFATKVLGLPYADATSKLLRDSFFQNLTGQLWAPPQDERVVMGVDTGLRLDYVLGNKQGLFFHGDAKDYGELNLLMERWPNMIAVIDAGGDLIGSRAFAEKWPGRVYLCYLRGTDRQKNEIITFGDKDEHGAVSADRNRMIQLVVDEFRTKRIPVHGTEQDWYEYWLDWNNLAKMKVLDPDTNATKGYKWVRSGRDHRALATVFWRVGMSRFAGMGAIMTAPSDAKPNSYVMNPDQTVSFDPKDLFDRLENEDNEGDWRIE